MNKSNLMKAALLTPLAGLLMGNQSCEKQPEVKARGLKKVVHMGEVRSPAMQLPGGQFFDFGFVANQQLYGILMENGTFALKQREYVQAEASTGRGLFKLTSSDFQTLQKTIPSQLDFAKNSVVVSKEAACMVNLPMAKVDASVNAFEMLGGGGLRLGFTPNGSHGTGGLSAGVGVSVEFAQLDVSMRATNPITGNPMAAANVDATQTKTKVDATISFGMFSIGPSAFYQTPLAKVTKTGLTLAVDNLGKQFEKNEWYSRVMYQLDDKEIFVVGGLDLNMKAGDEFALFNEEYLWDGEPCASTYRGGGSGKPVAVLKLEWVGDEVSKGYLTKQTFENVRVGSKVRLYKRAEDASARTDIDTTHLMDITRPK